MERTNIKIAILSTFPPRKCGLATFADSLSEIFENYVENQIKIIAVDDEHHKYPPRVIYEISQHRKASYLEAAEFVNSSNIEAIVLQHEYGIFGGEDGEFILDFLEHINKPVVTSLHSVLKLHSPHRFELTKKIIDLSNKVIVMTKSAKDILIETMFINPDKIFIVKHGVPNIRFDEKVKNKRLLGFKNNILLSTFGLLGPGKGLEIAINAMAKIIKVHPEVFYLIIGATHPEVLKREGEKYRQSLIDLVKKLKLEKNVQFINRYLRYHDLILYLSASDIYLSTNLDLNQAFSGTVSYALGSGCAVIAGPTTYAKEILANKRGIVTSLTPTAVSEEVNKLVSQAETLEKMKLKAYRYGRKMIWQSVGLQYLQVVESNLFIQNNAWIFKIPDFSKPPPLKYLERLTSKFGIYQHTKGNLIDTKFGFSLDDQVRALMVASNLFVIFNYKKASKLKNIYLSFMEKAATKDGKIHNFFNYRGNFIDDHASDDCVARSFWALASVKATRKITLRDKKRVINLLHKYEKALRHEFLRPKCYAILGYVKLKNRSKVRELTDLVVRDFRENNDENWQWFEDNLSWGNAIPILALIKAYELIDKKIYLEIALKALAFLEKNYYKSNCPSPVGQSKWYKKGQEKSEFDQQPIEAADMCILYNELFYLTHESHYRDKATEWFGWFYGNNIKNIMIYNPITEGVYDGLTPKGINFNQGAESIVTFLMAYLTFTKKI